MNIKLFSAMAILIASQVVNAEEKRTLQEKISFFSKNCIRSTTSATDFMNSVNKNKNKPKKENPFRKDYYFAKDTTNPLAEREKAMDSALETCKMMGDI